MTDVDAIIIEGEIWKFTTLKNGCSRITIEFNIPNTQIYRRQFPEVARVAVAPLKDEE